MDFKDLNLKELDKNLTEPERAEWQSIYASYRSGSVMYGNVVGVDMHEFKLRPTSEEEEFEKRTMRCLIVIPYRVKIIIPERFENNNPRLGVYVYCVVWDNLY